MLTWLTAGKTHLPVDLLWSLSTKLVASLWPPSLVCLPSLPSSQSLGTVRFTSPMRLLLIPELWFAGLISLHCDSYSKNHLILECPKLSFTPSSHTPYTCSVILRLREQHALWLSSEWWSLLSPTDLNTGALSCGFLEYNYYLVTSNSGGSNRTLANEICLRGPPNTVIFDKYRRKNTSGIVTEHREQCLVLDGDSKKKKKSASYRWIALK